ncbi:MAG: WD40/YVTN/BNR-like repeat-containing protein, partial [Planctomycetota bacterium]
MDDQTGYAAGAVGTILKTTDGGETWVAQTSGSVTGLKAMCFVNASVGFVVGTVGEILRTDDGGETWVPQTSNTTENLRRVKFPVDDQTGYICGDN